MPTAYFELALAVHTILWDYVYEWETATMGRTNIVLDDSLVLECQKVTGIKTRRALVDHALQELLRRERQRRILKLRGRVKWEGDLDEWRKGRNSK